MRERKLPVDSLPEKTVSETMKCAPIIHEDRNNSNKNYKSIISGGKKTRDEKIDMKESCGTFFPYIASIFIGKLEAWVVCMTWRFKCDSLIPNG